MLAPIRRRQRKADPTISSANATAEIPNVNPEKAETGQLMCRAREKAERRLAKSTVGQEEET
jgi:hypothetical protein